MRKLSAAVLTVLAVATVTATGTAAASAAAPSRVISLDTGWGAPCNLLFCGTPHH